MASQGSNNSKQFVGSSTTSVRRKTRATYNTLMRQSRKLGVAAVQTLGNASYGVRRVFRPPKQEAKPVNDIAQLKEAVAHSSEVLAVAIAILPFIFPDEICLDRTKITITRRKFFWSSEVISIRIEDVLNISTSVGPLFGSITIASRVMSSVDHFEINGFWRKDAIELKQIIQGYLIARQNGLETDHLSCEELVTTLREFGKEGGG